MNTVKASKLKRHDIIYVGKDTAEVLAVYTDGPYVRALLFRHTEKGTFIHKRYRKDQSIRLIVLKP